MSCYICDRDTLITVLKAQMMCDDCRPRDDEDIKTLWHNIIWANYKAYEDRYDEEIPDDLDDRYPVPFTITQWFFGEKRPNKFERYKALEEYMYQCAEGEYHKRRGYFQSRWCLDEMLREYIIKEYGESEDV